MGLLILSQTERYFYHVFGLILPCSRLISLSPPVIVIPRTYSSQKNILMRFRTSILSRSLDGLGLCHIMSDVATKTISL